MPPVLTAAIFAHCQAWGKVYHCCQQLLESACASCLSHAACSMDDSLDVGDSASVAGSVGAASAVGSKLSSPPSTKKGGRDGQSQSSTVGSDKSTSASNKKIDPNAFVCQLGGCKTTIAERVPGFQWCRSCKRIYDSLARMAKVQKEEQWWETTKTSSKDLRKAVLHCKKAFPNEGGRGKCRLPGFKVCWLKDLGDCPHLVSNALGEEKVSR